MFASLKYNLDGLIGRMYFGGLEGFGVGLGFGGVILEGILGVGVGLGLLEGYLFGDWLLGCFYC